MTKITNLLAPNLDELRSQVMTQRDWDTEERSWKDLGWENARLDAYDWRRFVGPAVRVIWETLSDEQKMAIATDAYAHAVDRFQTLIRYGTALWKATSTRIL